MKFSLTLLFTAVAVSLQAQPNNGIEYKVETGVNVSGGSHSPLWLNANKQGLSSINKDNGYLAAGVFGHLLQKEFSYSYGLELAGAYHFTSDIIVQQAYVDLKYHRIQLSIGSKERNSEFVDGRLSSGGLAFSGNARPLPQVRIELPEYITVPYTKGWVAVRGHLAYGWFTDGGWQKHFAGVNGDRTSGVLYHSKALYFKIVDPKISSLQFECGIQMECQFGGTRYYGNGTKYVMPEGIKDYFKALLPMHGGGNAPVSDQENIEGNMLGSFHFSLKYSAKDWEIHPYYEHYYEDQSMMSGKYPWKDGLIGLEVGFPKNRFISKLVMEYMGSMNQSGPPYVKDKNGQERFRIAGNDNYYNNGFYLSWAHWGMAIGNPLFMSPIYNKDGSMSFQSNRMTAKHIGIGGNPTDELSYRLLLSHTRNWGTYEHPYPAVKTNTSALCELSFCPHKLKGWSFTASAATDRGGMLGRNTGVMFSIKKIGIN